MQIGLLNRTACFEEAASHGAWLTLLVRDCLTPVEVAMMSPVEAVVPEQSWCVTSPFRHVFMKWSSQTGFAERHDCFTFKVHVKGAICRPTGQLCGARARVSPVWKVPRHDVLAQALSDSEFQGVPLIYMMPSMR